MDDTRRYLNVGDRQWPALRHEVTDPDPPWVPDAEVMALMKGFRRRRAEVVFESGWGASVLWGTGAYGDNHDAWRDTDPFTELPEHVEVGVLYRGELVGEPFGWVTADVLNRWLDAVSRLTSAPMSAEALLAMFTGQEAT